MQLAVTLLAVLVGAIAMMAVAPVANAASGETLLCKDYGFGCAGGGFSGQQTWGYPVDSNGHNCTNYAAYRLSKNGAPNPGNLGYAKDWDANARAKGFTVNGTPAVGAVAQWEPNTGHSSNLGHVAYVEEVGSNHIVITEDNYGLGYTAKYKITKGSAAWPSNFLHIKDVGGSQWNGVGDAKFLGTDRLTSGGQRLNANQYILSGNGQYALLMQRDGNLVLYGHGQDGPGRALWNSGTAGHNGANLVVQGDGNIVIYHDGKALWSTKTYGTSVNRLVVQGDGNLVAYNGSSEAKWASDTVVGRNLTDKGSDKLVTGQKLLAGEYIQSEDKRYTLLVQKDGNLVLYGPGYHVLWSSRTGGRGSSESYLGVQGDGNVVLYGGCGGCGALWATGPKSIAVFRVQNDGNLVGRDASGVARWASGTDGKI
jgi:surface antigen